ncbi:MAG: exopolyphosphatase [Bacteroidota bacterium]
MQREEAPLAVIDLGTNTFHLLVGRITTEGELEEVYRERRFVKLAEFGIGEIGAAAYRRGQKALLAFREHLDRLRVQNYRALATAALRRASNGAAFIEEARIKADINIKLITGEEEAYLIGKGVAAALGGALIGNSLIMDIGGGSVEFIIADKKTTYFAQSFPIGLAVLYDKFHHTEPIAEEEVAALQVHLLEVLSPLILALQEWPCGRLVGAAGVFDVLVDILDAQPIWSSAYQLDTAKLRDFSQRVIEADLEKRLEMAGLPTERTDLVVVAMLLIDTALSLLTGNELVVSTYAMKEGTLLEMQKA